jgi:rhodanese-related sulfurtransferase
MSVPEISVAQLADLVAAGGVQLIDVRNPDEYGAGHVGPARLIPLGQVPDRWSEVPTAGPVYIICKSGGRSLQAAEFLRARGIDAVNVAGGTMAWIDAGRPVETGEGS